MDGTTFYATRDNGRPLLPGDEIGYAEHRPWTFVECADGLNVTVTAENATGGARTFPAAVFGTLIYGPDGRDERGQWRGIPRGVKHWVDDSTDDRYTVAREFTGAATSGGAWVARFVGEWLGSATTEADAWAVAHYCAMVRQYEMLVN